MVFRSKWYVEVTIIAVILPLISIGISILVPVQLSYIIYLVLFIAVIIWRIRKKALTVKEAIVIVAILYGLNFIASLLLPIPISFVIPMGLTFLAVWLIYTKTALSDHQPIHKQNA